MKMYDVPVWFRVDAEDENSAWKIVNTRVSKAIDSELLDDPDLESVFVGDAELVPTGDDVGRPNGRVAPLDS